MVGWGPGVSCGIAAHYKGSLRRCGLELWSVLLGIRYELVFCLTQNGGRALAFVGGEGVGIDPGIG